MDLMTVEVLQRLLLAAAEEMGITLIRAAYSPNIKERRDASCAVFDAGRSRDRAGGPHPDALELDGRPATGAGRRVSTAVVAAR